MPSPTFPRHRKVSPSSGAYSKEVPSYLSDWARGALRSPLRILLPVRYGERQRVSAALGLHDLSIVRDALKKLMAPGSRMEMEGGWKTLNKLLVDTDASQSSELGIRFVHKACTLPVLWAQMPKRSRGKVDTNIRLIREQIGDLRNSLHEHRDDLVYRNPRAMSLVYMLSLAADDKWPVASATGEFENMQLANWRALSELTMDSLLGVFDVLLKHPHPQSALAEVARPRKMAIKPKRSSDSGDVVAGDDSARLTFYCRSVYMLVHELKPNPNAALIAACVGTLLQGEHGGEVSDEYVRKLISPLRKPKI